MKPLLNPPLNQKGQAMIEALIAGSLSLLSLYYIFDCGIKIINSTLQDEKIEAQYICQMINKNDC